MNSSVHLIVVMTIYFSEYRLISEARRLFNKPKILFFQGQGYIFLVSAANPERYLLKKNRNFELTIFS